MPLRHAIVRPVLALAVAAGALAATSAPAAQAADPVDQALARLDADADRPLTIGGLGKDGTVDFIGVPAKAEVDHPAVTPTTSPGAAADAAIRRYGAAIGAARPGTTLERLSARPTPAGDVARYQQEVDGVPVLGGQVVVSLRADGELSSVLSRTSDETGVAAALLGEERAADLARSSFVKAAGRGAGVRVASGGRWLVDPALTGGDDTLPARTAWRFEVTRGPDERRMILVDDRTGAVLMNADLIHHLDRVVCNDANTPRDARWAPPPCNAPTYARVEGGAATGDVEVDAAYDLAKPVSDLYAELGVDLTDLIGRTVTGVPGMPKALAQTVRLCPTGTPVPSVCPGYQNAFWNGSQMYYGEGYAGADDVVGHEMTHGVTERTSSLFYWGQSGAINESISDIMGEIVDQRHGVESDADWALGEDVPGYAPGGLRNLKDPTLLGDPDRTGSPLYVRESSYAYYGDSDGVHYNSGVGNKTAYLISQGDTFNGQTVAGIDAGDAGLIKSARLWLLVDQTLASGSDYADLALVLDQSCQALLARPGSGFTAEDCTAVHAATLATELRQTPAQNPQPADADAACPGDTTKRVLFDSETGDATSKFVRGYTWYRGGIPGWGDIAHSAPAAWGSTSPASIVPSSLTLAQGVTLPGGQPSYLHFQQWHLLEHDPALSEYYDGATVEIDSGSGPVDTAGQPWVNGPNGVIDSNYGNPSGGASAFVGDSRGYLASRLDLSTYAGAVVKPSFTMRADDGGTRIGWFLDDIVIYTCDPLPPTTPPTTTPTTPTPPPATPAISNTKLPIVSGKARVARTLKVKGGSWTPAAVSLSYQWLRSGKAIAKATKAKYRLTTKDKGKRISVRVTATKSGYTTGSAISKATGKVKAKKPSKKSNKKSNKKSKR